MTEIYVAATSGVLRAPSGTLFRLHAGKTLADGRHEAVTGSPESWQPMTVELSVDDGREQADPGHLEDDFAEELAAVEEERDRLLAILSGVVAVFDERGLLPTVGRDADGWLVISIAKTLDDLASPAAVAQPIVGAILPSLPEPAGEQQVVVSGPADPETSEGRAAIRQWGWDNGHDVAERGALPKSLIEAYEQAHA